MVGREHKGSSAGVLPYLRLLLVMALLYVFPLPPPPAHAHECPEFSFAQPEEGPLAALNCDFHHRYEERVAQTTALFGAVGGRPVILSLGGELRLKRNGGTETVDINPPSFDQIKAFSHALFAAVLAFSQVSPGALGAELEGKLRVQRVHRVLPAKRLDTWESDTATPLVCVVVSD